MSTEITTEEWRDIPDFPGYQVSDQGRVRSARMGKSKVYNWPWRMLKPYPAKFGYPKVSLGPIDKLVHHLVLEVFVGPRPEGLDSRHRDSDPTNSKLSNLWYGTTAQNIRDMVFKGNRRGQKMNPERVRKIKELKQQGLNQTAIARQFGIGPDHVSRICTGKRWGWLDTHVV